MATDNSADIASSALFSTEKKSITMLDSEKRGRLDSVTKLDEALAVLEIDLGDADEAVSFLKDHPDADGVTQEAMAILADEQRLKKLMRKIDWMIVP